MATPNKRKIGNSYLRSESLKHRRSSLRVNLSYSSDSGNESLKKSHVSNETMTDRSFGNGVIANRTRCNNTWNKSKMTSINQSNHDLLNKSSLIAKVRNEKNIKLLNVSVKLTDISKKEQTLHLNCDKLKDAILRKTQEIFDKKSELTIKTANVLANQVNSSINAIHHTGITQITCMQDQTQACDIPVKDVASTITLHTGVSDKPESDTYISNKTVCMSKKKKNNNQGIIATPKAKRYNLDNSYKHRPSKKRLFTNKDSDSQTSIKGNHEQLKKDLKSLSVKNVSVVDSPILSGSNKRFSRLSLKTLDKSVVQKHKIKDKLIKCISQPRRLTSLLSNASTSNALEDELTAFGTPIVCSTFIEDHTESKQNFINDANCDKGINKNLEANCTVVNNIEQLRMENTQLSTDNMKSVNTSNCPETNNNTASTTSSNLQNHESLQKSNNNQSSDQTKSKVFNYNTRSRTFNKSNDRNMEAITVNNTSKTRLRKTRDELYIKSRNYIELNRNDKQNSEQCGTDQDVSTRTIQSSLNVNTSLDKLDESDKDSNKNQNPTTHMQSKKDQGDIHNVRNKASDPLVNFEEQESINTVCTSLQVNTSLDSILKSQLKEGADIEDRFTEEMLEQRDTNSSPNQDSTGLKYTNLKKRLKTFLTRKQVNCNLAPRECNDTSNVEQTMKNGNKSKQCDTHNTDENSDVSSCMKKTAHSENDPAILTCMKQNNGMSNLDQEINFNHCITTVTCEIHGSIECNERNTRNNRLCDKQPNVAVKQTGKSCKTLEEVLQDTVVLDDTPDIQVNNSKNHSPTIINDTHCDNKSNENITNSNSLEQSKIVTKARGKRKLLPLHETSQLLSLTPLENLPPSPKEAIFNKRRRKKRFNLPNQKPLPGEVKSIINDKKDELSQPKKTLRSNKTLENAENQGQKQKKQRKVVSKKIIIKNVVHADIIKLLENNRNLSSEERHEVNEHRSSLNEFQAEKIISRNKLSRSKKIVVVTTGLSKGDKNLVNRIVITLGMARLEPTVTRHTTHVVCTGVRTKNLLHGIIRGCWLVSIEWVLRSLEHNKWLDPEEYEMKHFSKAVMENRKDRQLFGAFYVPELFAVCGLIYVENTTTPPANSLKELIKAAGGQITEDLRSAKVIIGKESVKETWVIDSITTGELQPFDQYKER